MSNERSKHIDTMRSILLRLTFVVVFVGVADFFFTNTPDAYAKTIHLYIDPHGTDTWSGTVAKPNGDFSDGPLASLHGARDTIRKLHRSAPNDSVIVTVAGGEYSMKKPLLMGPEDGGIGDSSVSYQAAPGSRPIFSGGRRITGFRPFKDGTYVADVPDQGYFDQLFVNGHRAVRARTPNSGSWFFIFKAIETPSSTDTNDQDSLKRAFYARRADLATLAKLDSHSLQDVNVVVRHQWSTSAHRLKTIDSASGQVRLATPAKWEFLKYGKLQGFFFENYLGALDHEGEWFLDKQAGRLFYKPKLGEDMRRVEVVAPAIDQFIIVKGDQASGKKVRNLSFRGLSFAYGNWVSSESRFEGKQAAVLIPATLEVNWADRLAIMDCSVFHVGSYGIWLHKGVTNSRIFGCKLEDLGAGGIRVGDMADPSSEFDATHGNHVKNNTIRSVGHRYEGAVGVWVGQSSDNVVAHNEIAETGYTGISVGWRWGYASSTAKRNVIELNKLYNIGRGILSDLGGIYLLGPSEGTVVRNNVIKNVTSFDQYGRIGCGVYADEGTSGVVIENNLVVNAKTGGFFQNYGRNNIIRNNIFAFSKDHQLEHSKTLHDNSFHFVNNIVYWNEGPLFYGNWNDDGGAVLERNVYFYRGRPPAPFDRQALAKRQALSKDIGSIYEDPGFIDPSKGNFGLHPNSSVLKVGFKPFNYEQAGTLSPNVESGLATSTEDGALAGVAPR